MAKNKQKRNKKIKKFSNSIEPLFFVVKNGEELPYSSCACSVDDVIDINGLEYYNQVINIELLNRSGDNPFGEETSSGHGEKERPVEDQSQLISALTIVKRMSLEKRDLRKLIQVLEEIEQSFKEEISDLKTQLQEERKIEKGSSTRKWKINVKD